MSLSLYKGYLSNSSKGRNLRSETKVRKQNLGRRYLFVTSQNRNRTIYPLASQFVLQMGAERSEIEDLVIEDMPIATSLTTNNSGVPMVTLNTGVNYSTTLSRTSTVNYIPINNGLTNLQDKTAIPVNNFFSGYYVNFYNNTDPALNYLFQAYSSTPTSITFFSREALAAISLLSSAIASQLATSQYRETIHLATIVTNDIGPLSYFTVRKKQAEVSGGTMVMPQDGTLTSAYILPYSGDLVGKYIMFPALDLANPIATWSKIIAYDYGLSKVTVTPPFATQPKTGYMYDILSQFVDNARNIKNSWEDDFYQSLYDVSLVSLNIPNAELDNTGGGVVSDWPFLFVQLINNNSFSSNALPSNNPTGRDATFVVPLSDVNSATPYLRLTRTQMMRTLNLDLETAIRFSVYLPNGELVKFKYGDTISPVSPNPFLQISCLFEIRKKQFAEFRKED